jgi:hypothetical protein
MYSIIAIISLIIILIEFYNVFKNSKRSIENKSAYNKTEIEKFLHLKYNNYLVKGDKVINHLAGYIYLKDNYNFFIKEKNKTIIAKKNKIYKIDTDFTVEVLDVNGKNVFYYYIKSQ